MLTGYQPSLIRLHPVNSVYKIYNTAPLQQVPKDELMIFLDLNLTFVQKLNFGVDRNALFGSF